MIAESYAKLGNWRQARQAVDRCSSDGCRVESLSAALTVWAEGLHRELAEEDENEGMGGWVDEWIGSSAID